MNINNPYDRENYDKLVDSFTIPAGYHEDNSKIAIGSINTNSLMIESGVSTNIITEDRLENTCSICHQYYIPTDFEDDYPLKICLGCYNMIKELKRTYKRRKISRWRTHD